MCGTIGPVAAFPRLCWWFSESDPDQLADVVVPYLVMHPGYAYGKLQLVGAALSGIQ